jgi:hypothetical protein
MMRMKTTWSISLAVLACLWAGAAEAAGKRVGVPAFDGVQEAAVRKKVMGVLQAHGFELVKSRQIESALQSTGARLDSNDGFQALAKELALGAIVTGEVGKKRAKITVYDGREGSTLGDATFTAANPHKLAVEVGRNFWKKLGAAVGRGKVPSNAKKSQKAVAAEAPEDAVDSSDAESASDETPSPAPRKTTVAAAEPEEKAKSDEKGSEDGEEKPKKKKKQKEEAEEGPSGPTVVPPTLDISLGVGGMSRNLRYHQPISTLRPYKLPSGFVVVANVVWYPLSTLTDGALQNLGVEGHVEQGFFIKSQIGAGDPDFMQGAKFNTVVHEYVGGLRFRVPFGEGSQFYVSATAGEHAFVFRTVDASMPRQNLDIPDTIYRFVRPGLGIRYELPADFSFHLAAGYRYIFNGGGQIKDVFFPHLSVGGVDVNAYIGYRFYDDFEVRLSGEFRRYFFSMNSKPEDLEQANIDAGVRVAGGAVDQYFSGSVSIAFLFGGTEKPAATSSEEEGPPPAKKKAKAAEGESEGEEGGGNEDKE